MLTKSRLTEQKHLKKDKELIGYFKELSNISLKINLNIKISKIVINHKNSTCICTKQFNGCILKSRCIYYVIQANKEKG